jgi:Ubiquitin-activating enzyme E1 FCCH domain
MTEYSKIAKGNFIATSASKVINIPFVPDFVEIWNYTIIKTAATHSVARAWWDNKLFDGANNPTMVELYAGSATSTVYDTIQTNGISSFQGGLSLQYGPLVQHTANTDFAISKANPAVITVSGAGILDHGLQTGDVVIFSNLAQTSTTGMQQIAGIPFMITRLSATTFSINWDTSGSNYTAFNTSTSTNNAGSYKKVLYPDLYFPGEIFISGITLGATTTVKTTTQHNFVVGQEVGFRIPLTWGPFQLNELPNVLIPGSPIYGYVVSITDLQTVVVNINSIGYTVFNANQTFAAVPGRTFPQIVAVGDINSGGVQISAGSQLYPAPLYSYASSQDTSTINGPAIQGAYVNNTRQGFIIGSGFAAVDTTSQIMASTNKIYWHAYAHDIGMP